MADQGTRDPTNPADADVATQPSSGRGASLATGGIGARYRLGELIGKGGMGDVLAASDEQIGREVAVKRMKAAHPTEPQMVRFFREACIQGRLDHPAIVPVHELGVDETGRPFFAMKRITGTTLAEHIAKHTPRERLLRAFTDVCLAVEFAHSRGVVHRDLKPQNIVLGEFGDVYVLDWGVAKVLEQADDPTAASQEADPAHTVEGAVFGSPGYMAPEQARSSSDVDARADVYALGCVLYEILAGERLHAAGIERVHDVRAGRASRPPRSLELAPELDSAWIAATKDDREHRIQTARELGERVQRFLDGDRDLATRRELARAHLEAARTAFASADSEETRRTAMREAGQALALDPALTGAAELVGRLMLEPPRELPPEVERAMFDEELKLQLNRGRAALWGHLGYLPVLFIVIVVGAGWYALALAAALAFNGGLIVRDLRRNRVPSTRLVFLALVAVIASVACMFSPFLIAPGIAGLFGIVAGIGSFLDSRRSMVIAICLLVGAILVPALGEAIGVLPSTFVIEHSVIHVRPPGLAGPPEFVYAMAIVYVITLVVTAVTMGRMMRGGDRGARRQLHLQAWQLRQLVA